MTGFLGAERLDDWDSCGLILYAYGDLIIWEHQLEFKVGGIVKKYADLNLRAESTNVWS